MLSSVKLILGSYSYTVQDNTIVVNQYFVIYLAFISRRWSSYVVALLSINKPTQLRLHVYNYKLWFVICIEYQLCQLITLIHSALFYELRSNRVAQFAYIVCLYLLAFDIIEILTGKEVIF